MIEVFRNYDEIKYLKLGAETNQPIKYDVGVGGTLARRTLTRSPLKYLAMIVTQSIRYFNWSEPLMAGDDNDGDDDDDGYDDKSQGTMPGLSPPPARTSRFPSSLSYPPFYQP